jgi:hypothetical protein
MAEEALGALDYGVEKAYFRQGKVGKQKLPRPDDVVTNMAFRWVGDLALVTRHHTMTPHHVVATHRPR